MGVGRNIFKEKYFSGAKFAIDGTGTNEGAENKNRTAKSVSILICLRF